MQLADIYTSTEVNPFEDAYLAHRHSDHHVVGYRTQDDLRWAHVDEATSRLYEYVVVNNDTFKNFMTFDLDGGQEHAVARALRLMEDYDVGGWVTRTPHGCHVGIMVDPVYLKGSSRAVAFYNAIWRNLNRVLDGDWSYGRHSTRNPLYGGTTWLSGHVYGLRDLRSALGDNWVQDSPFPSKSATLVDPEAGRNAHLFTTLVRTDESDLNAVADRVNRTYEEPLSPAEVASIVKSASKRRAKTTKKLGSNAIFTMNRTGVSGDLSV